MRALHGPLRCVFNRAFDNPIEGVVIPANQNTTALYTGAVLNNAPHPEIAAQWLEFLKSQKAQDIYQRFTNTEFVPLERCLRVTPETRAF
jgi:ABC-type Fe3+ transport system substrate-binding protein